jgi:hypothetical protein
MFFKLRSLLRVLWVQPSKFNIKFSLFNVVLIFIIKIQCHWETMKINLSIITNMLQTKNELSFLMGVPILSQSLNPLLNKSYETWGFHNSEDSNQGLLGHDTTQCCRTPTFQRTSKMQVFYHNTTQHHNPENPNLNKLYLWLQDLTQIILTYITP